MQSQQDPILFDTFPNGCRLITLNRPHALNALQRENFPVIEEKLLEWAYDKKTSLVVVIGAGDKAFCAGGDVKQLAAFSAENPKYAKEFVWFEYCMDRTIHRFPKNYLSIWNGIVMGGGVGISIHGTFRVATEKTVFSMPECSIGLCPDVGTNYFLSRCHSSLGVYIGLTGARLNAVDVLYAGLATHFVQSKDVPLLLNELTTTEAIKADTSRRCIENILDKYYPQQQHQRDDAFLDHLETVIGAKSHLRQRRRVIQHCFSADSVESIIERLESYARHEFKVAAANSNNNNVNKATKTSLVYYNPLIHPMSDDAQWALSVAAALRNRTSPTCLKICFESLRRARMLDIDECLRMDYRCSVHLLFPNEDETVAEHNEFREGVRATLVDRDGAPKWRPPSLADITDEQVRQQFFDAPVRSTGDLVFKPMPIPILQSTNQPQQPNNNSNSCNANNDPLLSLECETKLHCKL